MERVTTARALPSRIAFDASGRLGRLEAGYSEGEVCTTPRLLRLEPGGATTVVAGGEGGPGTGVVCDDGAFYVASFGAILRVDLNGSISTVLEGLPSEGDHHTNGPAIGPDGWLYFGQGTATNSGVVGPDNYEFGWLRSEEHKSELQSIMRTSYAVFCWKKQKTI